jgi:hypothetical protein
VSYGEERPDADDPGGFRELRLHQGVPGRGVTPDRGGSRSGPKRRRKRDRDPGPSLRPGISRIYVSAL